MMAWQESKVVQDDLPVSSQFWRGVRIAALSFAVLLVGAVAAGFIVASIDHAHAFSLKKAATLAAIVSTLGVLVWLAGREIRASAGGDPLMPRERANRNLLVVSFALGIVTAIMIVVASEGTISNGGGIFSNEPLPPGVAAILLLLLGIAVPAIGVFWHPVIDEQEADAYKSGALYGIYVYGLGAPLWWLAWRGGFVPEPNGFIIYYATITTLSLVWAWKKYR
jgi:hypothetical protein